MDDRRAWTTPDEAERRFVELLDEAELPHFSSTLHDAEIGELQLTWEHGLTIHLDLSRDDMEAIDDWERDAILGRDHVCADHEPIQVYVPGVTDDPRSAPDIPGVRIERGPPLHPDDLTTFRGIPVTSPSRTLIDCAEESTIDELREMFARARELGLLDPDALRASRARVEWRPSLEMLDQVIEEFCG